MGHKAYTKLNEKNRKMKKYEALKHQNVWTVRQLRDLLSG